MPNPDEIAKREATARKYIGAIYGKPGDEYGVTLFVSHHLKEIDAEFWTKHLGTDAPEPRQVLELLELRLDEDDEGEEDEIELLDFTLPEYVTDYVISVEFDETGDVSNVSMEN